MRFFLLLFLLPTLVISFSCPPSRSLLYQHWPPASILTRLPILHSWSPGTSVSGKMTGKVASGSTGSKPSLKDRLAKAGRGGLLAYGFLNAFYYCTVTLITFIFYFKSDMLKIPADITFLNRLSLATSKMSQVAAIVWAGSQVTKAVRIATAVALAPVADRLLIKVGDKKFGFICQCLLGFTSLFYFSLIFLTALR